jgi:hypothetical protein
MSEGFEVVGYYGDPLSEGEERSSYNVFVLLFDEYSGYYCYCPIGQHSTFDYDYLEECEEISREDYIRISGHLYTPEGYLC